MIYPEKNFIFNIGDLIIYQYMSKGHVWIGMIFKKTNKTITTKGYSSLTKKFSYEEHDIEAMKRSIFLSQHKYISCFRNK